MQVALQPHMWLAADCETWQDSKQNMSRAAIVLLGWRFEMYECEETRGRAPGKNVGGTSSAVRHKEGAVPWPTYTSILPVTMATK